MSLLVASVLFLLLSAPPASPTDTNSARNSGLAHQETFANESATNDGALKNTGSDSEPRADSLSPLSRAAAEGNVQAMRVLLDGGADLEARDTWGRTPLHFAATNGSFAAVRLLLHRGAAVEGKSRNGWTPLHRAAHSGNDGGAAALLGAGADADAADAEGDRPLHLAARHRSTGVLRLLLDHGAAVGARNSNGWTALHWSAFIGDLAAADLLLRAGADNRSLTNASRTPLDLAVQFKRTEVVELLRRKESPTF